MKKIYICSPLAGDVAGNIERARGYCRAAADSGVLPLAPHIYCIQFLDDAIPDERELGMEMGLELLGLCDEVWVHGSTISTGMAWEIALAGELGIPIIYMEGMKKVEKKYMADGSADYDMSECDSGAGLCQQL